MDLFTFKKVIGAYFTPFNLFLLLLFIAMGMYYYQSRYALIPATSAFVILFIFGSPYFADPLMRTLERQYTPYTNDKPVDFVVLLGSYHTQVDTFPTLQRLSTPGQLRLIEALRILNANPDAKLLTSGAAIGLRDSYAEIVKQAAMSLGVPGARIITFDKAKGTEEEAVDMASTIKGTTIALVTSANHLPRATHFFTTHTDANVIPSPAGYYVANQRNQFDIANLIPNAQTLAQSASLFYEYLGLIWCSLKSDNTK